MGKHKQSVTIRRKINPPVSQESTKPANLISKSQAFYINLVIGAIFAPALIGILPSIDLRHGTSTLRKLRTMDWLGIVIFFAGAICFTMALNFGGTVYGWSSGPEIVLWVCAGILLIGFILVSYYHPFVTIGNRLYPLHFYRTIEFANLQLQILLVSGAILTTAYYIPLYFQFARGDDAMQAAVRLLPFVLALVFASLCNGFFMPRVGYHKPWFVGGSALYLVGCALMCTFHSILSLHSSSHSPHLSLPPYD